MSGRQAGHVEMLTAVGATLDFVREASFLS